MKKRRQIQPTDLCWGTVVLLLIVLQFWWLPGERGAPTDSYSASLDGKLGLFRTLSRLYPDVLRDPLRLTPDSPATLLLIAPDRYPTTGESEQLADFVRKGGTLLFAPNWTSERCDLEPLGIHIASDSLFNTVSTNSTTSSIPPVPNGSAKTPSHTNDTPSHLPAEREPPDVREPVDEPPAELPLAISPDRDEDRDGILDVPEGEAGLRPQTSPGSQMQALDSDELRDRSVVVSASSRFVDTAVEWRKAASVATPSRGGQLEVLVHSDSGTAEVLSWQLGQGRVVACSSPDVFSNRSMLDQQSRRLAVRLVEYGRQSTAALASADRSLILCEYLTASSAYRHAGILLSPALRMGSLQLMLLAVLAGWLGFYRFGPPRTTHTEQRRNLSESAVAVGNLQYRLHDGGKLVRQYMEYVNAELRRTHGGSVQLDHIDELCRRTGMSEAELSSQLRKAERLQESTGVSSPAAAQCIRWLAELRHRLSRPEQPGHSTERPQTFQNSPSA